MKTKLLIIAIFVMLTLQSRSDTTGTNWLPTSGMIMPTTSKFPYVITVKVGTWAGNLPSVGINALVQSYSYPGTTKVVNFFQTINAINSTANCPFDIVIGYQNGQYDTGGRVPMITIHSLDQAQP